MLLQTRKVEPVSIGLSYLPPEMPRSSGPWTGWKLGTEILSQVWLEVGDFQAELPQKSEFLFGIFAATLGSLEFLLDPP